MVAVLGRIFGLQQLELIEDVVQDAFLSALRAWREAIPANPEGWLMQAAKNKAIDSIRRGRLSIVDPDNNDPARFVVGTADLFLDSEIEDSQLRLMFACCHPVLGERDQLAFTLQLASGFSVREIAAALLSSEESTKKRLQRARAKIKEQNVQLTIPTGNKLTTRLDSVLKVLYLTFNEGYRSSTSNEVIRRDLCAEAMRLTKLVAEHPLTTNNDSNAVLALMCYHAARFDGRLRQESEIVLLKDQDRSLWNREVISVGDHYFSKVQLSDDPTPYIVEAAIAAQHVYSTSYSSTPWEQLLTLYDVLFALKPTPVVWLNRAVVLAESGEPDAALAALGRLDSKDLVGSEHLLHCVYASVHEMLGDTSEMRRHLEAALPLARLEPERLLITQRLARTPPKIS